MLDGSHRTWIWCMTSSRMPPPFFTPSAVPMNFSGTLTVTFSPATILIRDVGRIAPHVDLVHDFLEDAAAIFHAIGGADELQRHADGDLLIGDELDPGCWTDRTARGSGA